MQSLYNTVKGKALGVAEYLTPVLKESKFLETGVLTPEEFLAAGDHLTHHCPSWRWDAGDPGHTRPYLPADKQFLVTRNVPCYRRINEMMYEGTEVLLASVVDGDDEVWVTHSNLTDDPILDMEDQVQEMTISDQESGSRLAPATATTAAATGAAGEEEKKEEDSDDEAYDMEEYARLGIVQEEDPSEYVAPAPEASASAPAAGGQHNILKTRTYDLHITYDKYYQTPRLFLTGYDEARAPLSVDAMYEDFSEDHANKTITVEQHPHIPGTVMATVHPCKHAETMKRLCEAVSEGGKQLEVHLYLIVFLKFMQAIIPTVEYDFTHDITM